MAHKNIYQSDQIQYQNPDGSLRTVHLGEMSWIFNCPDCPYIMTSLTEEGAKTLEHVHMIAMPATHFTTLKRQIWEDADLEKKVDREFGTRPVMEVSTKLTIVEKSIAALVGFGCVYLIWHIATMS